MDAALLLSILRHARAPVLIKPGPLCLVHDRYPDNYLIQFDLGALELISGKPAQALNIYREMLAKGYAKLERSVVLSRLGVASRLAGDFAQSERWLRESAAIPGISQPSLFIARLELGKTLDLEGKPAGAIEQYRLVVDGNDSLGIRQDAEQWLRRPYDRADMDRDNRGGGIITLN